MNKRVLVLQHTEEEGPGTLLDWLAEKKAAHTVHKIFLDPKLPAPEAYDWLVILGGPMNLDQEEKYPWLRTEKDYLRRWIALDKPVLGICLGGQLLAQALGGEVSKNKFREIGFLPVKKTGEHPALARWPELTPVFQWHEDRFTLPPGCVSLISSEACPIQAFAKGDTLLGLQFHPESTAAWIKNNYRDFPPANEPYVQNVGECADLIPHYLEPMTKNFFHLLDDFSAKI